MRQVVVPGARLHVDRAGAGEPLLWVTGFAISAEAFERVLPLFTPHFDCISYDNRAAGRAGSAAPATVGRPAAADGGAGAVLARVRRAAPGGGPRLSASPGSRPGRCPRALLHLWASTWHDTVAQLSAIQAPTVVLHGTLDRLLPVGNAELLAERIPNAELSLVEGAGHVPLMEQPEAVRDRIVDWMFRMGPVEPGWPLRGLTAAVEPYRRAFGLQTGAMRTGVSWKTAGARLAVGRRSGR